jgi:hypothetical protein
MIQKPSLLSTIPVPSQPPLQKGEAVPMVKVGDIDADNDNIFSFESFEKKSFFRNIIEKYTKRRMERLENTPPEKLTENEKTELEANRHAAMSLNYYV